MIKHPFPSFYQFFESLIGLNCQKLCNCMMPLYIRNIFFLIYMVHFFIKMSIDKFYVWIGFQTVSINKFCSIQGNLIGWEFQNVQLHMRLFEIPTRLDFFYQSLNGQIHLYIKLLDRYTPKYVLCILAFMEWSWQICDFSRLFSIVKLIFSKCTGWIFIIKILQGGFKFSGGDSENYFGIR